MESSRRERTVSSALWAAYGDILGFPTELVDMAGVQRRLGDKTIRLPKAWKRLVGGRSGTWIQLAAGSYSDDTQLRLSTSRSIRADGYFDVEAFAKVELPVWLSYALGAGRGSKVGASSLSQRSANWFTNFFDQRDVVYTAGGGNGAAMRIQPHVWAAHDLGNPASYLPDVIQNSICTHGHPRGIAGSVIHAVALAHILKHGEIPPPSDWKMFGSFISVATEYIEENADLSTFWLPTWNIRTGMQFAEEMERVRFEWERDVLFVEEILNSVSDRSYEKLVDALGGRSATERGSGIKCALISLSAAWLYRTDEPDFALIKIANFLGSDTDTIGTMTGALLGAINIDVHPKGEIQDREYIVREAERMVAISEERAKTSFTYPDLLDWTPPKSQADAVGRIGDNIFVVGLGYAAEKESSHNILRSDSAWQLLELSFGQTILCKRRIELPVIKGGANIGYIQEREKNNSKALKNSRNEGEISDTQGSIWRESEKSRNEDSVATIKGQEHPTVKNVSLNELTDLAIRSGFQEDQIGRDLLDLADHPNGLELAIAYAAVIVKARMARLKRESGEKKLPN